VKTLVFGPSGNGGILFFPLYTFDFPVISPLDNPFASAQGRHIFPLQLTLDPHLLIQRLGE
jgi:hypothetical protein